MTKTVSRRGMLLGLGLMAGAGFTGLAHAQSAPKVTIKVTQTVKMTRAINLRELADAAGYNGDASATYEFIVPKKTMILGKPGGGRGIDTGQWPQGATVSLIIQGYVYGGGGNGGNGGDIPGATEGGRGGDAVFIQTPMTLIIEAGASVKAGGGGGGGASGGGSGGGGGFPNGERGQAGTAAANSDYEKAVGETGKPGSPAGGGMGGRRASPGGDGGNAAMPGTAAARVGGQPGNAVVSNGHLVQFTSHGEVYGTVF